MKSKISVEGKHKLTKRKGFQDRNNNGESAMHVTRGF